MLIDFLRENRTSILQEWFDQTVNTYEPEMTRFLKKEKNQFSNPVRNTIINSLEKIYDGILQENDNRDQNDLEQIIKVRAVQDFSPSDALSFLFDLKRIIRSDITNRNLDEEFMKELFDLDERFESIYKRAFNIYNECRIKIHEIKIAEVKSRSERAFEILRKKNKTTE